MSISFQVSSFKNVIGVAQMVAFNLIYAPVKQQTKTKKILAIKLNLSSNFVIEFHVGGARPRGPWSCQSFIRGSVNTVLVSAKH